MVEEAKKLMADMDDDEVAPQQNEDAGPKIKMGRIKKGKKPKANEKSYTKQIGGATAAADMPKPSVSGGFNENDIEFMKKAIQILCQSTNPLGKSIDFVTDDVDSMSKEFEHWRRESISCTQELEQQQKMTEEIIQPLQDQLAELEERIREVQSKVNTNKAAILRNDSTIQNLLYSVIQAR